MLIVDIDDSDIKLDANGQPVFNGDGDFDTVTGDECWKQDLKNESLTSEGELFYEDEEDDEAYGFGMVDFIQSENDDEGFLKTEVQQRIRSKMDKRQYIDGSTVTVNITAIDRTGVAADVSFKRFDDETIQTLAINAPEEMVEVETEYD